MRLTYTVTEAEAGRRLQSLCRRELSLSAAQLRRAKAGEGLFVNGSPAFSNRTLEEGDRVEILLEEPLPEYPPEEGELNILFEDEHMLVLNKPRGLIVHPTHSRMEGTLANLVWGYLSAKGGEGCHAVNRLDRDTSGVILFAKSAWACRLLSEALSAEDTRKLYIAAVCGCPERDEGTIGLPICRPDPMNLKRWVGEDGEPAQTDYRVIGTFEDVSFLLLRLHSGRTHQIRVHCASQGFPVLGDRLYGTPEAIAAAERLGQTGQALHCCSLSFRDPIGGRALSFFCAPDTEKNLIFSHFPIDSLRKLC